MLIFFYEAVAEIVSICLGCIVVVILFVGAIFYRYVLCSLAVFKQFEQAKKAG